MFLSDRNHFPTALMWHPSTHLLTQPLTPGRGLWLYLHPSDMQVIGLMWCRLPLWAYICMIGSSGFAWASGWALDFQRPALSVLSVIHRMTIMVITRLDVEGMGIGYTNMMPSGTPSSLLPRQLPLHLGGRFQHSSLTLEADQLTYTCLTG